MSKKDGNWFKRHKILTAILVIVVIAIAASASKGDQNTTQTDKGSSTSTSNSDKKSEAQIAKLGEAARDGKFEFVVNSLECGKPNVGSEYLTKTAQGQYCMLNVTVKNIGTEKQSMLSSDQKLLNGEIEYSADDTATIYAAPNGSSWYSEINPGNSVEGSIVFDIPKDVTPTIAELHDSAFSNGIKVNLQ